MRSPSRFVHRCRPATLALILGLGCAPSEPRFPEPTSEAGTAETEPPPLEHLASYLPVGRRFVSGDHLLGRFEGQILANELAAARLEAWVSSSRMPEGAVLVQVHSREGGRVPGPIFGMKKREAGYFPEGNDWEYLVIDEAGHPRAQGKLPLCARCHAEAPADGVFLPKEAR